MLVNVGLALPRVSEPDIRGIHSREVLHVGRNLSNLGLEPAVSIRVRG